MPDTSAHPSPELLAAFDSGRLSATERIEIEDHLSGCDHCCREMEYLPEDALLQSLKTAMSSAQANVPPELIGHPRYEVLEYLGGGGMGSVFRAKHLLMDRLVALKVIRKDLMARPAVVERFRQEVKAAARLAHPNIITAHDAEQVGELHMLVMEYVKGANLERVVAARGPLSVAQACYVVQQAALGLQHACERGLVHRDVKPSNLLLTDDGQVKLLDFGLARLTDAVDSQTPCDVLVGTPDYLAPEQGQDARQAGIRADIYSLGCVLFFLLAGRPPFRGSTVLEKMLAHQREAPPILAQERPDVPAELSALVGRMLAKSPDERPQTPDEVARALAPFAADAEILQSFPTPSPALATAPTVSLSATRPPPSRRRPLLAIVLGTLLLAAVGVAIWPRSEPQPQVAAVVTSSATVQTRPTEPVPVQTRPTIPADRLRAPLSRTEMNDQALAWFGKQKSFQAGFKDSTTRSLNDYLRRKQGFMFEIGEGMVDSRRPTILLVRCGTVHVFALTDRQARNWSLAERQTGDQPLPDPDILDPTPAVELSDPQFDNALQLDLEQPLTGTVQIRGVAEVKGRLQLRFWGFNRGTAYFNYFPLPESLPAERSPLHFSFPRVKTIDNKPWSPGPAVFCLEVITDPDTRNKSVRTVISNSAASVVNVMPPPK